MFSPCCCGATQSTSSTLHGQAVMQSWLLMGGHDICLFDLPGDMFRGSLDSGDRGARYFVTDRAGGDSARRRFLAGGTEDRV